MEVKRQRHRCPKCRSNNIYKRSSCPKYTEISRKKGRHDIGIEANSSTPKKYRCINCKNEFDVPIIE
jgi:hypothetical protein